MQIEGRIAVVTGASSGIGAATAKALAAAGGRVVALARTQSALDEVVEEITRSGGDARAYAVDLVDPDAVARVAEKIREDIGAPDIVINNAGSGQWLTIDETTPQQAMDMMACPYFAAFNVTRAFIDDMIERDSGHIVNLTSAASYSTPPGAIGYNAARWAMRGFNQSLHSDLRGTNLVVTFVVPGMVDSGYFAHNPGVKERMPSLSKFMRTASCEDVGKAIVRGIQRNSRTVCCPFEARVTLWMYSLGVLQWVLNATGWRRPPRAALAASESRSEIAAPASRE